jgi:broad specificity phosphatase PhoE
MFRILPWMTLTSCWTTTFTRALSSTISNQPQDGWTDVAIQTAKKFTISQRKKLVEEGAMNNKPWPIQILGKPSYLWDSSFREKHPTAKLIHFQRHGQGYHNLICDMWRELNRPIDFDSLDPNLNPLLRSEVIDPPLTHSGILQCQARRHECSQLNPQAVVISPLTRCLQTAKISFRDHHNRHLDRIPWIAHEGCREELGLLMGNMRRTKVELEEDYPDIDFSHLIDNHDALWTCYQQNQGQHNERQYQRETLSEQSHRAYHFMTEFILRRPEVELAIVCHSAYLFTLWNSVMDIEEESLRSWPLTSEVRSLIVQYCPDPGN